MASWKTVICQSLLTVAVVVAIVVYLTWEADARRERSDRTAIEQSIAALEEALATSSDGPRQDAAKKIGGALWACQELKSRGPAAAAAVPVLIRSLKSINPTPADFPFMGGRVQINAPAAAREALVSIGEAAIPDLKKALHDDDALTRVHAARALWELERNADEVLPVLWDAWLDQQVYHQDANVRMEAGRGLSEIGRAKKEWLVPALSSRLSGDDNPLAYSAAKTLFEMTPAVPEALPPLLQALKGPGKRRVKEACDRSLNAMGAGAVPVLKLALNDEDAEVRAWAAYELGSTRKPEAGPILVAATNDRSVSVRLAAVNGLRDLYTAAIPAIPALEKLLNDPDEEVRQKAKEVLDQLSER
jgi:HEAT repeat protein